MGDKLFVIFIVFSFDFRAGFYDLFRSLGSAQALGLIPEGRVVRKLLRGMVL